MSSSFDRFTLLRPLGAGSSARVFEAVDGRDGRRVALKIPSSGVQGSPQTRDALEREARATQAARSPYVVELLEVVEERGVLGLVLELVEGEALAAMLERASEGVGDAWAVTIAHDVSCALHAIHSAVDERGARLGLVHGDLSPSNVLVGRDGVVRLTDFGVARRRAVSVLTSSGLVRGTPGYVAPEVIRGEPVQPASDWFSLGVVLYEAITGRSPFLRGDVVETLRATIEDDLEPLTHPLWPLIEGLTKKRPDRRAIGAG